MKFVGKIQTLRRVVIPTSVFELMDLKEGQYVQVTIEKVEA